MFVCGRVVFSALVVVAILLLCVCVVAILSNRYY